MAIVIIGILVFLLTRFFTKSALEYNDRMHSNGLRLASTFIIGIISLLILTAIFKDPTKTGFLTFMISLGVFFGFSNNTITAKKEIIDKVQIENKEEISYQPNKVSIEKLENKLSKSIPLNLSTNMHKSDKISFLQKINIFNSLLRKDLVILITLIFVLSLSTLVYFNRGYLTSFFVKDKINEEILKEREFKRTNYNAKIKFENNRLYFNIEIYNKYFGRSADETNIDIIFVDISGYSLEKVRIKANDLIKNEGVYYYKDNLQTKPDIYQKISNVEITFNVNRTYR
ncbi:MAG: hypothetical protein IT280_00275 [Ignavibacteria bacterium]|nr:hypothetical protein [Ignavibacteria bacterium]